MFNGFARLRDTFDDLSDRWERRNDRPEPCPKCGDSSQVRVIAYGLIRNPRKGTVMGGCCISEASPKWRCLRCKSEFGLS